MPRATLASTFLHNWSWNKSLTCIIVVLHSDDSAFLRVKTSGWNLLHSCWRTSFLHIKCSSVLIIFLIPLKNTLKIQMFDTQLVGNVNILYCYPSTGIKLCIYVGVVCYPFGFACSRCIQPNYKRLGLACNQDHESLEWGFVELLSSGFWSNFW